jgi:hypothetical protein
MLQPAPQKSEHSVVLKQLKLQLSPHTAPQLVMS